MLQLHSLQHQSSNNLILILEVLRQSSITALRVGIDMQHKTQHWPNRVARAHWGLA